MAEHIDNNKLHQMDEEGLLYRFQYQCKFMGFGEEDIKLIKGSAPLVAPLVPAIVDAVYVKLFSFDVTKEYFTKRGTGYKGKVDGLKEINLNSEQIKFRKDMLSRYLTKLVTAKYNNGFIKYLDWVAKIHTAGVGAKSINVDYTHINALMGYVEDVVLGALLEADVEEEAKRKTIRAYNKLLWIQNDLFARHYVHQSNKQASSECGTENKKCMGLGIGLAVGLAGAAVFHYISQK
mmetsp:Transcript_4090/g.6056  ORF Transcript_4090/g.6056 Transcript_4090/m.6056 type:complete len:235 (+) Transcript_4090:44-748(+)